MTAKASDTEREPNILKALNEGDSQHPGKTHIMMLRHDFIHKGPNGTHRCLIFDVMGPSVASMVENFPIESKPFQRKVRYPLWMAKSILRQTLLGLDYMHSRKIAHGDVQPGNILFPVKDLQNEGTPQLSQQFMGEISAEEQEFTELRNRCPRPRGISAPVQRLDGKVDHWAPHYLAYNQPLAQFADIGPSFHLKVSDFGAAFYFGKPPEKPLTPLALRSPELVVSKIINEDQDVWSYGCLIFEFLCGQKLFDVTPSFSDMDDDDDFSDFEYEDSTVDPYQGIDGNDDDDEHFLLFHDILGPPPKAVLSQWPRSTVYFNERGEKIRNYIGRLPKGFDPSTIPDSLPLEQLFETVKPSEMKPEESKMVKALLRQILQYDASKRPSTSELLQHPWFQATSTNGSQS